MIYVHNISPVLLDLGFFRLHWYGTMYLIGFLAALWLCSVRRNRLAWNSDDLNDALFYCALGVILGGRLGYMVFYNTNGLVADPLSVFYIWQGGMSFHGAVIGVVIAFLLLARKKNVNFFDLGDFILPPVPIGLGLGRLGNFINGELWGIPTNGSWGIIFPAADLQPRHPSQLYEMLLEGVILFTLLWWFSSKPKPRMMTSGLFLFGYGAARYAIEFVRVPDAHIGYLDLGILTGINLNITMGQMLSIPMMFFGVIMIIAGYRANIIPQYSSQVSKASKVSSP